MKPAKSWEHNAADDFFSYQLSAFSHQLKAFLF